MYHVALMHSEKQISFQDFSIQSAIENKTKEVVCKPIYSKTCLKRPLKIDKTKVLKTNGSLKKVESIAECSKRALCNTFDLH